MIKRTFALVPACFLALTTVAATAENSIGYRLQATVPVVCSVKFEAAVGTLSGGANRLGSTREYCNAPGGYQLVVQYSPGSLRGAIVHLGESRIVLDGSGTATIAGASGPKIQSRELIIMPSPNGFDTDSFSISALPN